MGEAVAMSEATAIIVPIVGTGIGIVGVIGLILRTLTTNIGKQFEANAAQMREMKTDLSTRIDETNKRIDRIDKRIDDTNQQISSLRTETNRRFESLTGEMHQRFDRVHQALGENRERMAKLEGSLDGFLAGRRDRDAA